MENTVKNYPSYYFNEHDVHIIDTRDLWGRSKRKGMIKQAGCLKYEFVDLDVKYDGCASHVLYLLPWLTTMTIVIKSFIYNNIFVNNVMWHLSDIRKTNNT